MLAASAPAHAAPKPITGKLNKRGYTVIALAANGRATLARARRGPFRLRPPADSVTLHLRAPNGKYAGPILTGRKATYAIVGVRAGARLGTVKINVRKGYAKLARRLPRRWLDTSRLARVRKGVPLGARNYGFVRSRAIKAAAAARSGPGGDRDSDGIPDALDVAASGDLVLNNFKRSQRPRAAAPQTPEQCGLPCTASVAVGAHLPLTLQETVNANAPDSLQFLDQRLSTFGLLQISFPAGGTTELDCGGRIYCRPHSQGGTGTVAFGPSSLPPNAPFPDCCDPDADGFGTMNLAAFDPGTPGGSGSFFLAHHATTAEIGTGDDLWWHVTTRGNASQCPPPPGTPNDACVSYTTNLQAVFATVPALTSYSDGAGHSATVSYPLPAPYTGSPPESPADVRTGFAVAPCPAGAPAPCVAGDVVLTFTFWRPQRKPIPPGPNGGGDACLPTCQWVDIGGLLYTAVSAATQQGQGPAPCPLSAFSTTDAQLTPEAPLVAPGGNPYTDAGVRDSAADRGNDQANRLTFSVDMTQCFASYGQSWNPGESQEIRLVGTNHFDRAEQRLYFKRQ